MHSLRDETQELNAANIVRFCQMTSRNVPGVNKHNAANILFRMNRPIWLALFMFQLPRDFVLCATWA